MQSNEKYLLIDGGMLGYAAMFSMRDVDLTNHDGIRTGIIYNFLLRMYSLGITHGSGKFVFCFDSPRKYSLRKKAYPKYKEKRDDLSDGERQIREAMHEQLNRLRKNILPAMGFRNIFQVKGFEADDIIAYIAMHYDADFVMVTADNDLYQCLRDNVSMYDPDPRRLRTITIDSFMEKYGIHPKKWRTVKVIAGCDGDNVKGIQGVGTITAIKYIKGILPSHYKAYQKIRDHFDDISEQNTPLVVLPHPSFSGVDLVEDELTEQRILDVFEDLDMKSFLDPEKWIEWRSILNV